MNETGGKLTVREWRRRLVGIGAAVSCLILAACSSSSQTQPPRTLAELLGQPSSEFSARPTKTELTPESLVRMGAQLEGTGDYTGAMRFYSKAVELEPGNIAALTGIGNVYLAVGIWNAGLNAFQQVRALDPRGVESAAGLAVALLLNDRPGETRQILNRQMAMTGPSVKLQNLLGLAEDLKGNHGPAQKAYSAALELNPGDGEVLTNLALSFALMGEYERAEAILQRGAGTPEAIPLASQNLALVYALRGQIDQALETARRELSGVQVEANTSFYERLSTLSARDRARAVFFGTLPPATETPAQPAEPAPQQSTPAVTPPVITAPPEVSVAAPPEAKIEEQPLPQEPEVQTPSEKPEIPEIEIPEIKEKPQAREVTEPQPEPQTGAEIEAEPPPLTAQEPEVQAPSEPQPEPRLQPQEEKKAEVLAPETIDPQATEPEILKPETREPEIQEPEIKELEPTEPEVAEPGATEPEASEPEMTQPEVTEPEATQPEVAEPAVAEPEATEPETTEPEVTGPEVTEPEVTEPEATEPEADLGPYWVQIGSYRYAGQIRAGWATLNGRHGPALEEVTPYAQHYDGGERGFFWRLLTSPAEERAIAQGDCELLLYAGLECFVIRTTGNIQPLSSDLED